MRYVAQMFRYLQSSNGPIHYLPAIAALNGKVGCNNQSDCGELFACMDNSKWSEPDSSTVYMQHVDDPNSDEYVLVQRPTVSGFSSFCSCDQTFAWSGYSCEDFMPAMYFELTWWAIIVIACCLGIIWSVLNLKISMFLTNHKLHLDILTIGIFYNICAYLSIITVSAIRLSESTSPKNFVLIPELDEKYSKTTVALLYMNVCVGAFTTMAGLQIILSWIDVVQKMRKFGKEQTSRFSYQRIGLLVSQALIVLLSVIFCALQLPIFAFAITAIFLIEWTLACVYASVKITRLLKESQQNLKSHIGGGSNNKSFQPILKMIVFTARSIAILGSIGVIGCSITVYAALFGDFQYESQSPHSNFSRMYSWGMMLSLFIASPLGCLIFSYYQHGILNNRIEQRKLKDGATIAPQTQQKDNSSQQQGGGGREGSFVTNAANTTEADNSILAYKV